MIEEINSAVDFLPKIMNFKFSHISRQTVERFIQSLVGVLCEHYNNHWFPEKPVKGSGYRCLRTVKNKMDPLLAKACVMSGLTQESLSQLLPAEFTMWIDPAEVSYRIGEEGSIGVVYSNPGHQQSSDDSGDSLSSDERLGGYDSSSSDNSRVASPHIPRATLQTFNGLSFRYLTATVAS